MTTWNPRHLPYPLLTPWNDDYVDSAFGAIVPHAILNHGAEISFTIKYNLKSPSLRELIDENKASFVALLTCAKTFNRNAYPTKQDEDVHVLNAGDYSGEIRLRPHIVALKRIRGFTASEHAEEYKLFKPEGFDITPASILAIGQETRITLEKGSPEAAIDLAHDKNIKDGAFKVELSDQRIKIYVSPDDKKRIDALRKKGRHSLEMSALFPAIYLHAITDALRKLQEYPDAEWVGAIRQALEDNEITADDEELKTNAITYAQELIENPVGTLLTALIDREED